VTQALRETFYYPPGLSTTGKRRDVEPIAYKDGKR